VAKRFRKGQRKPHAKPKRGQRRYSWALAIRGADEGRLSPPAREGLSYARQIARVAKARREFAFDEDAKPEPLTVERIAKEEGVSPVYVFTAIKQARLELFGRDLKDSAIYYRLRKGRERGIRVCGEPDCSRPIPALANGRRRYCDDHGAGAARVRRHRHGNADFAPVRQRRSPME
jgi:hypothetical protein